MPAGEFVGRFFDGKMSAELCKKCPHYGKRWACPPFAEPFDFSPFSHAEIVLRRVENVGDFEKTYFEARKDFDLRILKSESEYAVATGLYAGSCANCPLEKCGRERGEKCPFAADLRYSLEALGFDVSKIARELFGVDIEWKSKGKSPKFATLVAALFFKLQ